MVDSVLETLKGSLGQMSGLLTFVFLFTLGILYMFKKSISKYIDNRFNNKKEVDKDIKILQYHSMFTVADRVVVKINAMNFTTEKDDDCVKTELLRSLIFIKVKTVKQRFSEFLETEGLDTVEANKLKFMIATMLSSLVNEYNLECEKIMINTMGISKNDAQFLIESYESFRQYIVDAFIDELDSIVMDDNYSNNFERLNTILYTVSISLSIIPRDVVGTFDKVNGRFYKYRKDIKNEESK